MAHEELILKILGEHTERDAEVASAVLSYVSENPDWLVREKGDPRERAVVAVDTALVEVFGHPLSYYLGKERVRGKVEVRQMAFLILREQAHLTFYEIGKVFGKHHSTIVFGVENAKALSQSYAPFRDAYEKFKNSYLRLI